MKLRITKVDQLFSKYIRERDKHCLRCGSRSSLTCSHFWSRRNYSTRFDENNCITLCMGCHVIWESDKRGGYFSFMLSRLGQNKYKELEQKARMFKKRRDAESEALQWLKLLTSK